MSQLVPGQQMQPAPYQPAQPMQQQVPAQVVPQQAYQQPYAQPQQQYAQQPYAQPQQPYAPPSQAKDPGIAAALEVAPGFLFQTFGIGNMYAGNVGLGIALMIGYWFLQVINALLMFIVIGFFTFPLTWLIFLVVAPLLAYNAAKNT